MWQIGDSGGRAYGSSSHLGPFCLQGTLGNVLRHFGCHSWGSSQHVWVEAGDALSILLGTGRPPQQRMIDHFVEFQKKTFLKRKGRWGEKELQEEFDFATQVAGCEKHSVAPGGTGDGGHCPSCPGPMARGPCLCLLLEGLLGRRRTSAHSCLFLNQAWPPVASEPQRRCP